MNACGCSMTGGKSRRRNRRAGRSRRTKNAGKNRRTKNAGKNRRNKRGGKTRRIKKGGGTRSILYNLGMQDPINSFFYQPYNYMTDYYYGWQGKHANPSPMPYSNQPIAKNLDSSVIPFHPDI